MASKKPAAAKTAPKTEAPKAAAAPAEAPKTEAKVPLAKMRGPRGVAENAKITLLVKENPKRDGSKAHAVFSLYKDGMTVGAFCDAVDATDNKGAATPNLVYDAGHGFISIEGYDPGEIITPKAKAPKAEKEVKEPKGKPVAKTKTKAAVEEEALEETVD